MRLPSNFGRHAVIVLALLGAGFFAAWLRFLPYLEREATYTDGLRSIELSDVDRLRYAVWGDPVPLPPTVNTDDDEGRPTLSPDGRLLVFSVGERGLNADLWMAELVDGEPLPPRPLFAVNTGADELSPSFAGDALLFASNRPGGEGGLDLFRVAYDDGVFGVPERLGPGINSAAEDTDPVALPGSGAIAFASNRARGGRSDYDLFVAVPPAGGSGATADVARAPGGEPAPTVDPAAWRVQPFDALNTPFDEREPAFTADGLGLVFATDRDGTRGGFDLFRSVQSVGRWLPAEPVAGLNDELDQRAPWPSADGFTLLFAVRDARSSDLYRARSVELFRLPGRPLGWLDLTVLGLLLLVALLAWLGKRWEALDVLYKCLLVSLLVHIGLMLWFREVPVEHEQVELREGTPSFRVRLAPSRAAIAANAERGGQVEVARSETADMAAPARQELRASVQGSDSGRELTPAAVGRLPQPQAAGADAPGRAQAEYARAESGEETTVELHDRSESGRRLDAAIPGMTVVAQAGPAQRQTDTSPTEPRRSRTPATLASHAPTAPGPAPAQLTMPERTSSPALPGPRAAVDPGARTNTTASNTRQVALAGPAPRLPEPVESSRQAPAEMSLDALALAGTPAPMRVTSARPERSRTTATGNAPATDVPTPAAAALTAPVVASEPLAAGTPTASPEFLPTPGDRAARDVALREPASASSVAAGTPDATGSRTTSDVAQPLLATSLLGVPAAMGAPARNDSSAPVRPSRFTADTTTSYALPEATPTFQPLVVAASVATPPPDRPPSKWEHTPYQSRVGEAKLEALEEFGGTVETEEAVAAGLAYLARVQRRGGYWGSADDFDDKYGHVAVGKSALCLLAFLGAGHTPQAGTEHADVAARTVKFLLGVQDEATGHFGYTSSYSHAVTTYALAECYALTSAPELRAPLERAVSWILRNQSRSRDRRNFGGWGYYYPDDRIYDPWSRTSITAWQVMALESARLGGLSVPDAAFANARTFLRNMHAEDEGVLYYNADPERLSGVYRTLPGSTPAGLFALSLLGDDIKESGYRSALRFVRERAPRRFADDGNDAFVGRATGNLYFWYYGSLALLRHGGQPWNDWNDHLQETLLPAQTHDGSWPPVSPYAEYAGDNATDRSYTTAMCVLTLEVYYRYFTPLLKID